MSLRDEKRNLYYIVTECNEVISNLQSKYIARACARISLKPTASKIFFEMPTCTYYTIKCIAGIFYFIIYNMLRSCYNTAYK